jgi:hypothetical protein
MVETRNEVWEASASALTPRELGNGGGIQLSSSFLKARGLRCIVR